MGIWRVVERTLHCGCLAGQVMDIHCLFCHQNRHAAAAGDMLLLLLLHLLHDPMFQQLLLLLTHRC
jgi:hypothetical protein